jgi:hypothetical protein
MNLRVHFDAFNILVQDVFNAGGKIEEENQTCLFIAFYQSRMILLRCFC